MGALMRPAGAALSLAVLLGSGATNSLAQAVISAQAGLVNYTMGRVYLNNVLLRRAPARFPQMRPADVLRTSTGRGEVLVNPNTYLRLGENSAVRLLSDSVTEARFEVLAGSMILEVVEMRKGSSIAATWRGITFSPLKKGVYRLDTNAATLRVFDGEASVSAQGKSVKVGKGKLLPLNGTRTSVKFDRDKVDAFDYWSRWRTGHLAMENGRLGRRGRAVVRGRGPSVRMPQGAGSRGGRGSNPSAGPDSEPGRPPGAPPAGAEGGPPKSDPTP